MRAREGEAPAEPYAGKSWNDNRLRVRLSRSFALPRQGEVHAAFRAWITDHRRNRHTQSTLSKPASRSQPI